MDAILFYIECRVTQRRNPICCFGVSAGMKIGTDKQAAELLFVPGDWRAH